MKTTRQLFDAKTVAEFPMFFYDVTGEGNVTALDALRVINFLGRLPRSGEAVQVDEGESTVASPPAMDVVSSGSDQAVQNALNLDRLFATSVQPVEAGAARVVNQFSRQLASSRVKRLVVDSEAVESRFAISGSCR